MRIDSLLYRGHVNKDLRVSYCYNFEPSGKYQTVIQRENGNVHINPSFGISISEGYDKNRMYIPANNYYPFASLMKKSIKLISDNLFDIFPNINNSEFEIDSRVLQRFQTEQAISTCGMTIIPTVWVDENSACYPAIKIDSIGSNVVVPLEDAISISKLLNSFEPHTYGLSVLRIIGKID